ncbi:MAG: family 20 glycosylhydrolase [Chitinophagaceae bacterium]|nr:family 20 glycosylhydrolase [Chitinophagaceae bacterium]
MKSFTFLLLSIFSLTMASNKAKSQSLDSIFPVRGLCIAAPAPAKVDSFITFIKEELAPRHINTLILRVDFNYKFISHPELIDTMPLSRANVKKLVKECKKYHIRLIPQINLLGHQSWQSHLGKLLAVYPEFDETPWISIPEKYQWPNRDELYCKSYCPLHPKVHDVVFALIDEICEVFESDAFHAGMDEVFYIGTDLCPRCQGHDKAELFAGEVRKLRDHLAETGRELWIWGDRLLEGKVSGMGMWEASYNNTHRAINMIPKDVFICDWHYERPDKTPVIFATKGFRVATAPWRIPQVTSRQVEDMATFRNEATPQVKNNYSGLIQTVWSHAIMFIREANQFKSGNGDTTGQWASFVAMTQKMDEIAKNNSMTK